MPQRLYGNTGLPMLDWQSQHEEEVAKLAKDKFAQNQEGSRGKANQQVIVNLRFKTVVASHTAHLSLGPS